MRRVTEVWGLFLAALVVGPGALTAQEGGSVWDMEPSEEVTAVHEYDGSGAVGHIYVFHDEFYDYWPSFAPNIPADPIAPPEPESDPCLDALEEYLTAQIVQLMAAEALATVLAEGFTNWQWRTDDGQFGEGIAVEPGDPGWQQVVNKLTEELESTTQWLEDAADAVAAACQQS